MQYTRLLAAAIASLVQITLANHRPMVLTTSGAIIGHAAHNRTGVTEFLGIRYAEAPVGELRFAAPKKYIAPESTVFEASEWVRRAAISVGKALTIIVGRLPIE
jgi:hypothetical protein